MARAKAIVVSPIVAIVVLLSMAGCESKQESNPDQGVNADAATGAQPAVELYTLNCGEMEFADLAIFADDGAYDGMAASMVDPCYLVRHPEGDLLWDLGLPQSIADNPDGADYPQISLQMYVPQRLTDQLAELGLAPEEIDYVAISHSHFDHIGNGNLFAANSTWIVDADELAYAFRPEAREDPGFANYNALEDADRILIEGDDDYDVFGDGSVVIVQAPGHTPGHSVLLVNLPQSGPYILAGDLWHIAQSRPNRRVPRFNVDREQTLGSMDKVEALADVTGARVVLQHVPEDFAAMPEFPEPLR